MTTEITKRALVCVVLVSILSLVVLAACAGAPGKPGKPGLPGLAGDPGKPRVSRVWRDCQASRDWKGTRDCPASRDSRDRLASPESRGYPDCQGLPGAPGEPGKPGLPGRRGSPGKPGLQGSPGIAPHANVRSAGSTLYLDGIADIWGSGFQKFEPVTVYIDLETEGASIVLGSTDADAGGAWQVQASGYDQGLDASTANALSLGINAGSIFSIVAEGADGTKASTPVRIAGQTPPPPLPPATPVTGSVLVGSFAADGSFRVGVADEGGEITLVAAGFSPGEFINVTINGISWTTMIAGEDGGAQVSAVPEIFVSRVITPVGAGYHQIELTDSHGGIDYKAPIWILPAAGQ